MNDEKKGKKGIAKLMIVLLTVVVIIIVLYVYTAIVEPYRVADQLRNRLKDIESGYSEDYRQGWLDCVSYYINEIYGPKNATVMFIKPCR